MSGGTSRLAGVIQPVGEGSGMPYDSTGRVRKGKCSNSDKGDGEDTRGGSCGLHMRGIGHSHGMPH